VSEQTIYTPGPWTATSFENGAWWVIDGPLPAGANVADAFSEIDARLIAAAPDLLEALLSIWQRPCDVSNRGAWVKWAKDTADAAIEKATGEALGTETTRREATRG
jgi:hypothetical protein